MIGRKEGSAFVLSLAADDRHYLLAPVGVWNGVRSPLSKFLYNMQLHKQAIPRRFMAGSIQYTAVLSHT